MPNLSEQQKTDIYSRFYVKVFGYLYNHVNNSHTAEDLCSTVFVKVFEKLDSFDEKKASLSTWIYTITKRTLIDHYKTYKTTVEVPDNIADESTSAGDALCNAETLEELADALRQLDQRLRTIVVLRYYHNLTFMQIAKQMHISYGYAKVLHAKAINKLKKLL